MAAGVYVAAGAVLRGEYGNKVDVFRQDVYGGLEVAVNAGRVGQKADALALEALEAAVAENFYSGFYLGGGHQAYKGRKGGQDVFNSSCHTEDLLLQKM